MSCLQMVAEKIQFCRVQSSNIILWGDWKSVFEFYLEGHLQHFVEEPQQLGNDRHSCRKGTRKQRVWRGYGPSLRFFGGRVATGNRRRRSIGLRRRSIAGGIGLRRRIPIDRRRRLDPIRRRISDIQRRRGTFERSETLFWDDWLGILSDRWGQVTRSHCRKAMKSYDFR